MAGKVIYWLIVVHATLYEILFEKILYVFTLGCSKIQGKTLKIIFDHYELAKPHRCKSGFFYIICKEAAKSSFFDSAIIERGGGVKAVPVRKFNPFL